jgi:hypothetical protein
MRRFYYEPHEHPKLSEVDPLSRLPRTGPVRKGLNYIVRGVGGIWKRHHHVQYVGRVATSCAAGDAVPHTWNY